MGDREVQLHTEILALGAQRRHLRYFFESVVTPSSRQKRVCQYGRRSNLIVAFMRLLKLVAGLPSRSFRRTRMPFFSRQFRDRHLRGGDSVFFP